MLSNFETARLDCRKFLAFCLKRVWCKKCFNASVIDVFVSKKQNADMRGILIVLVLGHTGKLSARTSNLAPRLPTLRAWSRHGMKMVSPWPVCAVD